MPASFDLQLDTTPPSIQFGFFRQPNYDEDFVLPFVLSEPQIIQAFLVDSLGAQHALIVRQDGTLWRFIDASVAPGTATVRVTLRDVVLNETTSDTSVTVSQTGRVAYSTVANPKASASVVLLDNVATSEGSNAIPLARLSDAPERLASASDRSALTTKLLERLLS